MKMLLVAFLTLLSTSLFADSSSGNGNGGGVWVCMNKDEANSIRWIKLIDIWEGINEYDLEIPLIPKTGYARKYEDIISEVMVRRLFSVSESMYRGVNEKLDFIMNNVQFKPVGITRLSDANYNTYPLEEVECVKGEIRPLQIAIYKEDGRIIINDYLFNQQRFSETDSAALLIHEAVYAYLREKYNDKTSDRARRIVGLLFSTLPLPKLAREIEKVLGSRINFAKMEFKELPGGPFMMGSPSNEVNRDSDEGQHAATVSSFEMQTTELTQRQWLEVMGGDINSNPSRFKKQEHCPFTFDPKIGCPDNPVEQVSYDMITKVFLPKLNAMKKDGYFYRLPTEAEWEYAARSNNPSAYSFGNDPSELPLYAWYGGNPETNGHTHEVAKLQKNGFNLYDMSGNVWEWTDTYYNANYSTGSSGSHEIRGGSWNDSVRNLRSANRNNNDPGDLSDDVGFRLARTRL